MDFANRKLSLLNTVRFCWEGFRQGGAKEARRRLRYFRDQHLDRWIGPWYRRPVVKYYARLGIAPVGGLGDAIAQTNRKQLRYFAHAIKHLTHIPGVVALLAQLSVVERTSDEDTSHQGERRYHNLLVELHGCYFLHRCLGMQVTDVEHEGHNILSPNRLGGKSCDIKGLHKRRDRYFECKDSSWEIITKERYHSVYITTPKTPEGCRAWLLDRMADADVKGADYLIAKMPMRSRYSGRRRLRQWVGETFPSSRHIRGRRFVVPGTASGFRCVKGAYVLTLRSAIELRLE